MSLEPRDLGGEGSGNFGHSGRPGEVGGSAPSGGEEFQLLKGRWARVNNEILMAGLLERPNSAEARTKIDELKDIVKQMHHTDVRVSTLSGVGVPGGPRDIVVVGAGPGGLAAATMGGTDGLDTLLIDENTEVGGQAKFSSRIENYPGFPIGTTGKALAESMLTQAERVGAEAKLGVRVTGIAYDSETDMKTLTLSNGETVQARAVILAGGVEFSKPTFPGGERAVIADAEKIYRDGAGKSVVIAGGSNGAAQAALGAARSAERVTVISRSPIEKGMSDYQVTALRNNPKITVVEGENIDSWQGSSLKMQGGRQVNADVVGIFYGGKTNTNWLPAQIGRHEGKVDVNIDLETSMPGVFAIGDMRRGSIGRIGAAVGDGQVSERNVFKYFERNKSKLEKATNESLKKAGVMKASEGKMSPDEWDLFIDRAFALDEDEPFLSQMEEEEDGKHRILGGPGSGNFGHAGRPGEVGGSLSDNSIMQEQVAARRAAAPNPEFHRAINEYTWTSGDINSELWRNPNSLSNDARLIQDTILSQPKFERPITVYRGVRDATEEWVAKITPGTSIEMNGFQSTSPIEYEAKSFSDRVLLRINAVQGLVLDHTDKLRVEESEEEVLLPHKAKYIVRGYKQDGKYTIVDLDQQ